MFIRNECKEWLSYSTNNLSCRWTKTATNHRPTGGRRRDTCTARWKSLFSFQVEPSWAFVLPLFVFPSGCFSSWISSCVETFKLPTILLTFFSWFLMVCKITWVHTIWLCNWCNFMVNVLYLPFAYAASRGFSFAWLLAFTKSFTCLFSRVVGLFTPRGVSKPTTRQTRHVNDFVNAKSHAKEKPLLAGYRLLYL